VPNKRHTVLVCEGTGCVSGGSEQAFSLKDELKDRAMKTSLSNAQVAMVSASGPLIVIEPKKQVA
jgi:NADH:ubiquinone oxidoreductase subunit E